MKKDDLVTIEGEGDKAWRVDRLDDSSGTEHAHLTDPDNEYVHTAAETSRLTPAKGAKKPKSSPASVAAKANENNVLL